MTIKSPLYQEIYHLGAQVSGLGIGIVDYVNDTITLDERAAAIFDLPADAPIQRSDLHQRIHPDDREVIDHQVTELLGPDSNSFIDVKHRILMDDQEIRWVSARKQVTFSDTLTDQRACPVSGLVAIMDITEQQHDREKIKLLLAELNHRSKNQLTIIQALANRTLATGDIADFKNRFSARIEGLVRNSDTLAKGDWIQGDLRTLIHSQLAGFVDTSGERVSLAGAKLSLNPNAMQTIGMAIHELATNAVKYGAFSNDTGQVHISWGDHPDAADMLRVIWQESGGPSVTPPERTGFGQTVMKEMAMASLGGTVALDYKPDGVVWQLDMPRSMTA